MAVFDNAQDYYRIIGGLFEEALADPVIGPQFAEVGVMFKIAIPQPEAVLLVHGPSRKVHYGDAAVQVRRRTFNVPLVEFEADADVVHRFFAGQVNATTWLPMAIAKGDVNARGPFKKVFALLPLVKEMVPTYERLLSTGGRTVDLTEAGQNGAAERLPAIEVDDVHKTYGTQKVLNGLTVNFVEGAITTVLGPSGTGKSVLLKHIVALTYPDSGDIRVFGQSVTKMSDDELFTMRENFGVLFQDGALFGSMNLYDNIAFPLRQHTRKPESQIREIVMERLGEVGLDGAQLKMPGEISGGMRKRAGFARALVLNPNILLFDEPDSGLDPVRTSLLGDLILQVHAASGGTYVVVTHNIAAAQKLSDYVGLLWKGKLVHYDRAENAFKSEDPFVHQFLSGDSAGPLGMD